MYDFSEISVDFLYKSRCGARQHVMCDMCVAVCYFICVLCMSARVPTFNSLIDNIQRKKYRESLVIVLTVSAILCFFIWWIFLR